MKAVAQQSALAQAREAARARDSDRRSREQSASGTSGTYLRAPRPPADEAARLPGGASSIDRAKIEGLRFELDIGVWRADSERIARCVMAEAVYLAETDDDA